MAILLACRYYGAVIPLTRPYISNHLAADLAAFGILLLALLIVAALLSSTLMRLVQVTALNGLDRTLGAGFGILRGALLVVLLFLAAQWLLLPEDMQTLEQNGKLTLTFGWAQPISSPTCLISARRGCANALHRS